MSHSFKPSRLQTQIDWLEIWYRTCTAEILHFPKLISFVKKNTKLTYNWSSGRVFSHCLERRPDWWFARGKHRPLQVSMLITVSRCRLTVAYIWPFEVDHMCWIMHAPHFCCLNKITAGKLPPLTSSRRTGGRSFTSPQPPHSLSKTVLGKHNYSWKHFGVTLLGGGMKVSERFSFFLLIWEVFNLHFPQAWLNPQLKLAKLSFGYVALTVCLTENNVLERRQRSDETQACTLGVWAELGYTSAEGLCTLHHSLLYFLPTRLEFALKLEHIFLKGEEHCTLSPHPVIPSPLCISLYVCRARWRGNVTSSISFKDARFPAHCSCLMDKLERGLRRRFQRIITKIPFMPLWH